MKQKVVSEKRALELSKLYNNNNKETNNFKIKISPQKETHNNYKKTKSLSTKELLFSLLLTFIIITVQLFISQFI